MSISGSNVLRRMHSHISLSSHVFSFSLSGLLGPSCGKGNGLQQRQDNFQIHNRTGSVIFRTKEKKTGAAASVFFYFSGKSNFITIPLNFITIARLIVIRYDFVSNPRCCRSFVIHITNQFIDLCHKRTVFTCQCKHDIKRSIITDIIVTRL